ncbi:hypothetical protein CsSME_00037066 [Camellia sinensis var. sinensis]
MLDIVPTVMPVVSASAPPADLISSVPYTIPISVPLSAIYSLSVASIPTVPFSFTTSLSNTIHIPSLHIDLPLLKAASSFPVNSHSMVTRSKSVSVPPLAHLTYIATESNSYKEAAHSPD